MSFALNAVAIITILVAYSVLMWIVQNLLAAGAGLLRLPATRTLAVTTSFASSFIACACAIGVHEYALRVLEHQLSIVPILIWGTLQVLGAARSFGGSSVSLIQAGELIMTGGDPDAPRFLFFGQFYGLLVALGAMALAHFTLW